MPIALLLAMIQAGAQLAKSLPEIKDAIDKIQNPTDQAALKAELARWQEANDAAFERVNAKLDAAATQG